MVYQGTVQDGVVVLENGAQLPEGAAVTVELRPQPAASNEPHGPETDKPKKKISKDELDPIFRMGELAVDTGISDLAVNIDHYLYGHPKVEDVQ